MNMDQLENTCMGSVSADAAVIPELYGAAYDCCADEDITYEQLLGILPTLSDEEFDQWADMLDAYLLDKGIL